MPARWVVAMLLVAVACYDDLVVTERFDSLEEARSANLFQRGWLPDILPPSAHDLRLTNDLDRNVSSGRFEFSPEDFEVLRAHLENFTFAEGRSHAEIKAHIDAGHPALKYVADASTWVFLCVPEQGECQYHLRLSY